MPLLMAHQVNREGIKAALKVDRLEMTHMAETSEVERTATIVYGLMANEDEQKAGLARLQMLASRRTKTKTWKLVANPSLGVFRVIEEI